MLLLIFLLPVAEIWLLIEVASRYGVINTIFALVAFGVLGAGLARAQGLYILRNLQGTVSRGEVPTQQILQSVLVFIGGVLFIIPGFITDAVALLMVLPGSRHLLAYLLKKKIAKNIQSGRFQVFTASSGFGAGFGTGFGQSGPFGNSSQGPVRDVTPLRIGDSDAADAVIDVTPIKGIDPKNNPKK
jgi:UPF0716 protein FxsA